MSKEIIRAYKEQFRSAVATSSVPTAASVATVSNPETDKLLEKYNSLVIEVEKLKNAQKHLNELIAEPGAEHTCEKSSVTVIGEDSE